MSLSCLACSLLSNALPGTKTTPDVEIKTVKAAKALRKIGVYDIKFMIGCGHEWEFSDYNGPLASGPVLQVACAGVGVCWLISTFDFLGRQFYDEGRAKRNIPWRCEVRARAGSGAARGVAAAPGAGVCQLTSTVVSRASWMIKTGLKATFHGAGAGAGAARGGQRRLGACTDTSAAGGAGRRRGHRNRLQY
jgi:hypothetical protein